MFVQDKCFKMYLWNYFGSANCYVKYFVLGFLHSSCNIFRNLLLKNNKNQGASLWIHHNKSSEFLRYIPSPVFSVFPLFLCHPWPKLLCSFHCIKTRFLGKRTSSTFSIIMLFEQHWDRIWLLLGIPSRIKGKHKLSKILTLCIKKKKTEHFKSATDGKTLKTPWNNKKKQHIKNWTSTLLHEERQKRSLKILGLHFAVL